MQTLKREEIQTALNEKKGWQTWWRLLRPHTLTASFVPVFVGTMLAIQQTSFHFLLFLAMMTASIVIQAATNMFNEYYDYVRGLDNENSIGIGGAIVRDGIQPKTIKHLAITLFVIAVLLGVYISIETTWWVGLTGAISMIFGYLYTGGPYPIAYTPFGELTSGTLMGTVIVAVSFFIQTGYVNAEIFLVSIPVAIFIGSILLANNIRDRDGDKIAGRKTIAILLGHKKAIRFLAVLYAVAYGLTFLFIILGILPWWSLIGFLSIPKAKEAVQGFVGKSSPLEMLPAMKSTSQVNTFYGFLVGISLFISFLFQ
ncbi:1,4-dihydroxy-2-naphthoate polyprenyltransferase [Bacillaceae bacterium S4-13-56]